MRKREKREKGQKQIQLKETIPFSFQMRIFLFLLNVVIKEANNIIKSLFYTNKYNNNSDISFLSLTGLTTYTLQLDRSPGRLRRQWLLKTYLY